MSNQQMKWNPFAALQQQRAQDTEDAEAQALLADAIEPDHDQGQTTDEPPKPPDMNDIIRQSVGVRTHRDRQGRRVPEIGD